MCKSSGSDPLITLTVSNSAVAVCVLLCAVSAMPMSTLWFIGSVTLAICCHAPFVAAT